MIKRAKHNLKWRELSYFADTGKEETAMQARIGGSERGDFETCSVDFFCSVGNQQGKEEYVCLKKFYL